MKTSIAIILSFIIFGMISCSENVLDKQPLDKISDADVWNDVSLTKSYVTNLYTRFPFNAFSDWYRYGDEATYADGPKTNITQGTVSRSSEGLAYWDYGIIRDCNIFLEKMDKSPLTVADKKQYTAEVRVIRAVTYFEMAKRYGGVPLVKTVLDAFAPISDNMLLRNKEVEMYDYIIKELTESALDLSDAANPRGRINKWVATAYKSRVCLWAASIAKYGIENSNGLTGVPPNLANGYFNQAYDAAESIISSGKYSIFNNYADKTVNYQNIFLEENNGEVIFSKIYDGMNVGQSWDKSNSPPSFVGPGAGKCNPVWEMLESYENTDGSATSMVIGAGNMYNSFSEVVKLKDPRLNATIMYQGSLWQGDTVMTYSGTDTLTVFKATNPLLTSKTGTWKGKRQTGKDSELANTSMDNLTKSGFYINKYRKEAFKPAEAGKSDADWIEIRLAEMYLIKAETAMELNKPDIAAQSINVIRNRAGITLLNSSTITLDKVRHERYIELAFENHRYWDLRRWRIAHKLLNHKFGGVKCIYRSVPKKYYFTKVDAEDFTRVFNENLHYYNPITLSRISNMPSLVENPNY